ncbi:MAG TPA: MoaD/ThiS family protein [Gemmatimonadaceae bacterium]|nr:MoaD/ThiS family protein [Gemmatimonadaceae bacterium]
MSTATVQVFASYAELLGANTIQIVLPDGATVDDVVAAVRGTPGGESLPSQLKIAVNREFAGPHQPVSARDELALIPPVAGG